MKFYYPLIVLMALHVIFLAIDAYTIDHLDSVMHLAGGLCLAACVYGLLACVVSRGWYPDPGLPLALVLVVALVVTGAVFWEFYEWLSDALFATRLQPTVNDTVKDLFLGLLGGCIYAAAVWQMKPAGQFSLGQNADCQTAQQEN